MSELAAAEVFRVAQESIEVPPPPFAEVVAESRAQERHHRRVVVGSVAALVAAVGAIGWLSSRTPAEESADLRWPVVREHNSVDVAWYAGGTLHLTWVSVKMPPITQLVAVDDGAVVTDADGAVVFVDGDGKATDLGHLQPGARVAAADQTDRVGWIDATDGVPRVVVHDLAADEDVGTLEVPPGSSLIAVDQARVFFATPLGEFQWQPGQDPELLDRSGLLDVGSGTRAYAVAGGVEVSDAVYRTSFVRPGTGATISPGARFVLSRAGDASVPFRPLVYDARSGRRLPSGLARGELALDATFGPNHTISYLVSPRADLVAGPDLDGNPAPLVVLRTCDLTPVSCHDVIPLARPDELPLLAH